MTLEKKYYEEGDTCPLCKKDMLVVNSPTEATGGLCELRCQRCNYDATDDKILNARIIDLNRKERSRLIKLMKDKGVPLLIIDDGVQVE